MNPKISAYAHVYRTHNYNAATFVPIGMETLVHDNPNKGGTFADHLSKGYILGTDFENYRSWIMWMEYTRAMQILATFSHKHKHTTNPEITPEDQVIAAAGKLADDIKGRMSLQLRKMTLDQLKRIGTILKQGWTKKVQKHPPGDPPTPPPSARRLTPICSSNLPSLRHWQRQ